MEQYPSTRVYQPPWKQETITLPLSVNTHPHWGNWCAEWLNLVAGDVRASLINMPKEIAEGVLMSGTLFGAVGGVIGGVAVRGREITIHIVWCVTCTYQLPLPCLNMIPPVLSIAIIFKEFHRVSMIILRCTL